jgi:hypothetical protein
MKTITVKRRLSYYMAWITDDKAKWDWGDTPDRAIANLRRTWPECANVTTCYYYESEPPSPSREDKEI